MDRTPSGPKWLGDSRIAQIVAEALHHGEKVRKNYELIAWVIMPNHLHVVLTPIRPLPEIMRWLKTATAYRANRLLGTPGTPFWQREYFDRWMRSRDELASVIDYIEQNPVAAGLVESPEQWPWSSAHARTGDKIAGAT